MSNKFKFIEQIFLDSGLTERQFAKAIKVPQQTLRYWLGRMRPDAEKSSLSLRYLIRLKRLSKLGTKAFWAAIEEEFGNE